MSSFNANSNAKTRAYIVNNSNNRKLEFQFNPTRIPYGRSATYATIDSPGMSYPLTQYVGGQVREFSFDLYFYDYVGNNKSSGKINTVRKFLEELLPPEDNRSYRKPPTFTLAFGYFVKTLVLINLEVNDDWIDEDGNPISTTFSLTVRQVGKS